MGFDRGWFDELRALSQVKIDLTRITGISRYVPHVGELLRDGHISDRFYRQTADLVDALTKTRYSMDPLFRAGERHTYDFLESKAYKKQWNIGFRAGITEREDYARIGLESREDNPQVPIRCPEPESPSIVSSQTAELATEREDLRLEGKAGSKAAAKKPPRKRKDVNKLRFCLAFKRLP